MATNWIGVSIHAPAWGATVVIDGEEKYTLVSIHAPAWGATRDDAVFYNQTDVSIHAPAWGATMADGHSAVLIEFQSTRPRGARLFTTLRRLIRLSFNPRARVGRDIDTLKASMPDVEFQSTRPRGARLPPLDRIVGLVMFQSTRPRGARPSLRITAKYWSVVSIHAPAWGATCLPPQQ